MEKTERIMSAPTDNSALVVIALDASEPGDFAIELAGSLAGTAAPELLGLFVENALLLEHASSRQAREILLTGGERALDRDALERQLRSQAERARARFEAASVRLGLAHRFEVARGDILAESVRRAAAARMLVVGRGALATAGARALTALPQQMLEARLPLVLLARESWQRGRAIAAIVDAPETADAVLDAAGLIARHSGSPLTVLLAVEPGSDPHTVVDAVRNALRRRGIGRSNVIPIGGAKLPGIERAARACQARLLVTKAPAEADESAALAELLRCFTGAVLLVRSGHIP
jgi:hypothetical protein